VVAPSDRDLAEPALARGLAESFAGGGYSATQRAALLQMAWDHVGSALDHREHVFELHANGGILSWRGRLRRSFDRYNELANGVLQGLSLPMPEINLDAIRNAPLAARRPVNPTAAAPRPATERDR
jgi:4-hydroxyphenylacetate 3-monooxygenase